MSAFNRRLYRESEAWVAEGLVSEEQRQRLLARHPHATGPGRLIAVLAAIGGALVLAGICLVISANWQRIGHGIKIGGVIALLLGAHAAGWRCKVSPGGHPRWGDVFFALGAGFFLCGIALISQVYHLNARPANYVLAGWLGLVALPWLVRAPLVQGLVLVTGFIWLAMETTTPGSWLAVRSEARWGNSLWLLLALAVPLALALWLAGVRLRASRHASFASLHEFSGMLLACGALYFLGFLRHDHRAFSSGSPVAWAPALLVAAVLFAAALAAWRGSRRDAAVLAPWMAVALIPAIGVLAGVDLQDDGWLWSAFAWAALFALNLAMIRVGLKEGRPSWVNLALPLIALNIFTRYLDLFGTMMEGGVFFVVTGLVILGVGYYLERKRRTLLASLAREGPRS